MHIHSTRIGRVLTTFFGVMLFVADSSVAHGVSFQLDFESLQMEASALQGGSYILEGGLTPIPYAASTTNLQTETEGIPSFCGNNEREGTEACDGSDFDGATCQSLGFSQGSLSCSTTCTLNTTGCSNGGTTSDQGTTGGGGGGRRSLPPTSAQSSQTSSPLPHGGATSSQSSRPRTVPQSAGASSSERKPATAGTSSVPSPASIQETPTPDASTNMCAVPDPNRAEASSSLPQNPSSAPSSASSSPAATQEHDASTDLCWTREHVANSDDLPTLHAGAGERTAVSRVRMAIDEVLILLHLPTALASGEFLIAVLPLLLTVIGFLWLVLLRNRRKPRNKSSHSKRL